MLAFKARNPFKSSQKLTSELAETIQTPGECFFVVRAGNSRAIAKSVAKAGEKIL